MGSSMTLRLGYHFGIRLTSSYRLLLSFFLKSTLGLFLVFCCREADYVGGTYCGVTLGSVFLDSCEAESLKCEGRL
jgi:hypothetical protein